MQSCFGIDYVNPSTAWADIVKGPPAAASRAHVAKILAWNAPRAEATPQAAAHPPLRRAA